MAAVHRSACQRADGRADRCARYAAIDGRLICSAAADLRACVLAALKVIGAKLIEILAASWKREDSRAIRYGRTSRDHGGQRGKQWNKSDAFSVHPAFTVARAAAARRAANPPDIP
jgi:hypothetical protein